MRSAVFSVPPMNDDYVYCSLLETLKSTHRVYPLTRIHKSTHRLFELSTTHIVVLSSDSDGSSVYFIPANVL